MHNLKKLIFSAAIIYCCSITMHADNNAIMASVNGKAITQSDITMVDDIFRDKIQKPTLEQLVERELILAEFRTKGYRIPPKSITLQLDKMARKAGYTSAEELCESGKEQGLTQQFFYEKAEENIMVASLLSHFCRKKIVITPKEIYEYYQNNYSPSTKVVLDLTVLPDGALTDDFISAKQLTSLAQFRTFVKEQLPSHKSSLDMILKLEDLAPEIQSALQATDKGVVPLVKVGSQMYLIYIQEKVTEGKQQYKQQIPAIRKAIYQQRYQENYKSLIEKLKGLHDVKYF